LNGRKLAAKKLMVLANEEIARALYAAAAAAASGKDIAKFVSLFSDGGYMRDMCSGLKLRGQALGDRELT
jgi:hypothetical protein